MDEQRASDDLLFMAAGDLAAAIRKRDLSPTDIVEAVLARIEATQGTLNAFITVCADEARAAARAAEAAIAAGGDLPPLLGVPVSVKDIINTAGIRTTWGSRLMESNVPDIDNVSVARLKAAGAIIVGKTTTPEFAHKQLTDAPLFGITRSPWDPEFTPGGSSGGGSAAVAAGMGPLSLATDAAGSTRLPASCTATVGFKPTLGLAPHAQVPDAFGNFIHLGTISRTVADAALMTEIIAGPHPKDPQSLLRDVPPCVEAASTGGSLEGLRFAWRPRLGSDHVDAELLAIVESAVAALGELGATIDLIEDPFENVDPVWRVLQQSNWLVRFNDTLEDKRDLMDSSLVRGVEEGRTYSALDLQRAAYRRTALYRTVQGWFDDYDAILTPTMACPPLRADHDVADPVTIGGRDAGSIRQAWAPYLNLFNLSGHPAVSVPAGWTAAGLPVGLQIVGRYGRDDEVLRYAAAFEGARPWAHRRPPHAAGVGAGEGAAGP